MRCNFFQSREEAFLDTLSVHSLETCHRRSCLRFTLFCLESTGTMNSTESRRCCLGEYRQVAGSLVSPGGSGASTSISHTGKLPASYLIPFILGLMNSDACTSEHVHMGNGESENTHCHRFGNQFQFWVISCLWRLKK